MLSGIGELSGAGMAMSARGHGKGEAEEGAAFWAGCAGCVVQGSLQVDLMGEGLILA